MTDLSRDEKLMLADNGTQVLMLQTALSNTEAHAGLIPRLVIDLAREGSWKRFTSNRRQGVVFEYTPADFRRFLEAPIPAGCGAKIELVERMLRGTDAWEVFLELTRGEPGGSNNPEGANQHAKPANEVNRDHVTVDQPTPLAPAPEPAPPPARDYSREAPTGNSVSYALRRLQRNRPDLYDQVKAGAKTASAAMVEAGFRAKTSVVPADPVKAIRILWKKLTLEQREAFLAEIR